MAPVTTKEIKEIIKSLPWKNSSGYDAIPLRILKIHMPLITSPLTCGNFVSVPYSYANAVICFHS